MKCLSCQQPIKSQNFYGLHKNCFLKCFKLTDVLEFSDLDPKKQDSFSNYPHIKKIKDSFYHGRYRKYSAQLGSTAYILKVQEEKCSDLPVTEYVCNNIASFLNLDVPECCLIRYSGDSEILSNRNSSLKKTNQEKSSQHREHKTQYSHCDKLDQAVMTFVTRNFMQDYKGGTLHHIYKFLPKGKKKLQL